MPRLGKISFGLHAQGIRSQNLIVISSFVGLSIFVAAILRPIYIIPEKYHINAATGTATQATTSLALISSHNSAVVDVTPNNKNGTFATSSADKSAAFNVTTNNYTGYSLSITGSDNNGNLTTTPVDSSDPVRTISSISTIVSTADFSAATTASSTNYSNKWGYKPSKYVDTSTNNVINNTGENAVYLPAPTTTPTMLDKTTAANSLDNNAASANNYTLSLGIRADFNTKPGTYTNTFNLLAISNPISYTINYDKNTTDTAVSNIPARQSSSTSETTITLASTVPTRTHYSFIGWCNKQTTTSNGVDSCTGTGAVIYNPNGNGTNLTYGIDQTTENTTTLRAMWKIDTFTQRTYIRYENADGTWGSYSLADTKVVNYGSPYSWSTAATASHQAASVSSYTVTENHDNYVSIYRNTFSCYIQSRDQAANGNYGAYVARINTTLRYGQTCAWSANADVTYKAVSYSTTITSNISQSLNRDRQSYTCYIQSRTQYANGTYTGYTARVNQSMLAGNTCAWSYTADATYKAASYSNTNITSNVSQSLNIDRQSYTCYIQSRTQNANGTYTGYTARVNQSMLAGNTCAWSYTADATYKAASYSNTNITSNVSQSLNIDRQVYTLTVSSNTSYISSVTGGGSYRAGDTASISATASSGNEFTSWTQTAGTTSSFGNAAAASTTFVMPSSNATVYANGKTSKLYMQDITNATCPTTRTLAYDKRDEKQYYIMKINGVCWMTTNLDLAGGTTLTSATSNVTSNYTLPANTGNNGNSGVGVYWNSDYSPGVYNSGISDCNYRAYSSYVYTSPCYSYYTFTAATAATNIVLNGGSNSVGDICPKGWRLPSSNSEGSPTSTVDASPWYISNSGLFTSGQDGNRYDTDNTYYNWYWSSSSTSVPSSDGQHFGGFVGVTWVGGQNVQSGSGGYVYAAPPAYGLPVRCRAKS